MSASPLLLSIEGAVATLTLNRPSAGNTINMAMAQALLEAAIRCVVLTGNGKVFCARRRSAPFPRRARMYPQLANAATAAIGGARALLLESGCNPLEAQLERETGSITAAGATAECREGVAAFLARRKPDFSGVS